MLTATGIPDRTLFWGMASTQLIGWGTLYVPFPLLVAPMEAELGWSRVLLNGAYTAGLLASGLAGPLTPQGEDYVKAILESVERLTGQIENVLDLTQSEAGNLPLVGFHDLLCTLAVNTHSASRHPPNTPDTNSHLNHVIRTASFPPRLCFVPLARTSSTPRFTQLCQNEKSAMLDAMF